ncbi:MAG: LPP20 family lipoprotein, partial [Bacteroidota bacterium]
MRTTVLYLLLFLSITSFAQRPDCDVSLTADRYFNSMAIAPTEEEAQANALNFLATQISATVSAKSELISTDQNTRVDQTFVSQSQ